MPVGIKLGTDNKLVGTYVEHGPQGDQVKKPRIVNIDKSDHLPPTSKPGNT